MIFFLIKMTTGIPIYLKIDRPVYSLVSFSINDVAIFVCVIDKQYDSLSDLIISFGIAKKQITFYRLCNFLSIGTQNILIIFISTSIFAKYGSLYSKYVHMRRLTADTDHLWAAWGGNTALYPSTQIYCGSDLWTLRTAL